MPAKVKRGVSIATRYTSLILAAAMLSACGGDSPTGEFSALQLPPLVEFRGMYTDQSTCIDPAEGSWPITVWLFDYNTATDSINVAVNFGTGGKHTSGDQFRGTLTGTGELRAFSFWRGQFDKEYEVRATVSPTKIFGDIYSHCHDGTADIWRFSAERHSP